MPRTLITNARVLSLHPGAALLDSATLVLDNGVVADLVPEPAMQDAHAEYIDAGDALVVPGFVNAHTHAYSALVRGMPEPIAAADFGELLRNLWWKLDFNLSLDDVAASAMLMALDGLRCGVTTVVDHHASYGAVAGSLESVAAGFEALGQRALVCFEVSDRLGADAAAAALEENARHAPEARQLPFRLGSMLGLHASFTLSDDTLARASRVALEHGLRMHIHAAEDRIDRTGEAGTEGDSGVVERLKRFDLLQAGALVAHGVHLSQREMRMLAEHGVVIAHNPRSNMNNGVGRADLAAMWRAGVQVALGTDAYGAGVLQEARVATLAQRQAPRLGDGAVVAESLLHATPHLVAPWLPGAGRLTPGSPADVVVTRYVPPTPMDAENVWSHLLFADIESKVRSVFVAGERVLDEGRSTRIDEIELATRCRTLGAGLWERFRASEPKWTASHGGAG